MQGLYGGMRNAKGRYCGFALSSHGLPALPDTLVETSPLYQEGVSMPTINYTRTLITTAATLVEWTNLANGDDGQWYQTGANWADRSIDPTGNFGGWRVSFALRRFYTCCNYVATSFPPQY